MKEKPFQEGTAIEGANKQIPTAMPSPDIATDSAHVSHLREVAQKEDTSRVAEVRAAIRGAEKNEIGQDAFQRNVLNYCQRELPFGEHRIATPMRPECKVAVAIPAYEEGAGIINSLEHLASQDDVKAEDYEVVININNRKGASDETKRLNGQTMAIISYLSGESGDVSFLSEQDRQRLHAIKEKGLIVYPIDKFSSGNETEPIEDPDFDRVKCMQPRKRTMDEIAERFALSGHADGIIASLDADTKVTKYWIKGIIESFADSKIQMVAGERRDGRDLDSEGHEISQSVVMERLMDDWNSDERKKDPAFAELPNIESAAERIRIALMNQLIGEYNAIRGVASGRILDSIEHHFKGGSGKMFRVGAYIQQPKEIIKIMDAGGKKPERMQAEEFLYAGEKVGTNPELVDALAVFPETRVRGWDVRSGNGADPYQDFNALKNPFGSSGKEYAYAIAAGIRNEIPTTFNPERQRVKKTLMAFIGNPEDATNREQLKGVFTDQELDEVASKTTEQLRLLGADPESWLAKKMAAMPESISIIEALRLYAKEYPQMKASISPERQLFGDLVKRFLESGENDNIVDELEKRFSIHRESLEKMKGLTHDQLIEFVKNDPEMSAVLARLPEYGSLSLSEAADAWERVFAS